MRLANAPLAILRLRRKYLSARLRRLWLRRGRKWRLWLRRRCAHGRLRRLWLRRGRKWRLWRRRWPLRGRLRLRRRRLPHVRRYRGPRVATMRQWLL